MKQTKRLLSVFLALCLLLGLMPATAWAASALEITQQPTAENNYTVKARYMGQEMTEGFQWYKKVDTATTYTLVQENPQAGELAVDAVYFCSYTDGHWAAEDEKAPISVSFLSSPNDEITVTVLSGGDAPVGNDGDIQFTEVSSGVYTATSMGGMLQIYIDNSAWTSAITATITVKRCWTPLAGQTSASLTASESGTYYCAVSKDGEGAITKTVTILSQEEQATADWLADSAHQLTLGPTTVTADNAKDILGDCKASFALVDGMPTLTLNGVNVTEGIAESSGTIGLTCSDALTIALAEGSDNTITLTDYMPMGIVIGTPDDGPASPVFLTVTGKGTLTVDVTGSSQMCIGVATKYGVQVTGGAKLTATASVPTLSECFGLWIQEEGDLRVSGGGVVRLSSTGAAAVFGGAAPQIPLEEGYSIRGSTAANDFDSLTDAELGNGIIMIGDELAKSVVIAPHSHAWSTDWTTDDTHHWHECTAGGCSITDYAACGEAGAAYDDHTKAYDKDDDQHWEKCSVCGWTGTKTAHTGGTATCTAKAVCTVCGQSYGGLAAHDFTRDYRSDASGHWHKCKNCDAADTKAGHVYDNDQDTECNTCGYTRTVTPDSGVTGEVEIKPGTGTPQVSTDTKVLEELAGTPQAGETITVKLTVEKKDESTAAGAAEIKGVAAGKTVEFLDLSLVKTVTPSSGGSSDTLITDTNGKVLEIVVSYSFTGKKDVKVYRYHDGKAEALNQAKGDAKAGGTFKLGTDSVTIYATKFSTYAIGYTAASQTQYTLTVIGGTGGGNYAAGTTVNISAPVPSGKQFTGWTGATVANPGSANTTLVMPAQDTTVTANFQTIPSGGGGGWSGPTTYPIEAPGADGGKVAVSPKNAASGTTVTITLTPDEGYKIGSVIVTDRNGKQIAVTDKDNGKYTFTMPSGKVTVTGAFAKIMGGYKDCPRDSTCPIWPYTDTSLAAWYHDGIHFCVENGLMNGYGNGKFGPNDNLTRAQFAQILHNREGRPVVNYLLRFEDVPNGAWYTEAVRWAAAQGIVSGYGNGKFGPNDPITREQLAVMLWRYVGSPAATKKELRFTDAGRASGYALEALHWAVEHGIINGYGDGRLDPRGLATRAQVAQVLKNYFESR